MNKRHEPSRVSELDALLAPTDIRWDTFYADRAKPCPFFVAFPDESLAEWVGSGRIAPGRALDLGCGHGRNAVYLAKQGFHVEGIDLSATALQWARDRAVESGVDVTWRHESVFDAQLAAGAYALVHDAGCFHHIAPHRREQYVDLVVAALRPGGWSTLTAFRPEGGSGLTDEQVYERGSLGGGLGYTEAQLRTIWSRGLEVQEVRQMRKTAAGTALFGEDFLWVLLARKR
ncbi:class I SAM-dependent methyltransferase [Ramlibacter sp. MMS24-I3-19]|uniref:class I SAM-dependent methyltransferase n=1 Tax=Ramlibacter sp. MMS24-I3-19 TaxID=3416606 RepID=UPI003D03B33D